MTIFIDNPNEISQSFQEILSDLKSSLSVSNVKRIEETVLAAGIIEKNIANISQCPQEKQRLNLIHKLTGIHAEPGFCEGDSSEEILKSRVNALISAYQTDKATQNLDRFFKRAFTGDPCLNGRFITLQNYIVTYQWLMPENCLKDETSYDDKAQLIWERMYGVTSIGDKAPSLDALTNYLKSQSDWTSVLEPIVQSPSFITTYRRALEWF